MFKDVSKDEKVAARCSLSQWKVEDRQRKAVQGQAAPRLLRLGRAKPFRPELLRLGRGGRNRHLDRRLDGGGQPGSPMQLRQRTNAEWA